MVVNIGSIGSRVQTLPERSFAQTLKRIVAYPLTSNIKSSAKMLWGSILASTVALQTTLISINLEEIAQAIQTKNYFSVVSQLIFLTQSMLLSATYVTYPFFHAIRLAFEKTRIPPILPKDSLPSVTIQIPSRNEPFDVLRERSLATALAIREQYPQGKLKIQLVDNSDTGKYEDAETYCKRNGIQFIHREGIQGAKSRNLNLGLEQINTDYTFVMDADIMLEAHSLNHAMGEFVQDPQLGFLVIEAATKNLSGPRHIFARLLERTHNFMSPMVQVFDDYGYAPLAGYSTAINTKYLKEVGGWSETHIGEDYELGVRFATYAGWYGKRISYVKAEDPALLSLDRWKTQQYRWAYGTVQTFRSELKNILFNKKLDWHAKVSLLFRLSHYPVSALLVFLTLLNAPFVFLASQLNKILPQYYSFKSLFSAFALFFFPAVLSLKNTLKNKTLGLRNSLTRFFGGIFIGGGILFTLAKAIYNGILCKNEIFKVTPKGRLNPDSFFETINKYKWEFGLGAVFMATGIFSNYYLMFLGLGCIFSPFISWWSNRQKTLKFSNFAHENKIRSNQL